PISSNANTTNLSPSLLLFSLQNPWTSEVSTLSLHDALPISVLAAVNAAGYDAEVNSASNHPLRKALRDHLAAKDQVVAQRLAQGDRKSTRLNSSHVAISYAVFCSKKKEDTYSALSALPLIRS